MNDHRAWEGNIDDVIVASISDYGIPLVDLTNEDGNA
jgi:hypothetical protein